MGVPAVGLTAGAAGAAFAAAAKPKESFWKKLTAEVKKRGKKM